MQRFNLINNAIASQRSFSIYAVNMLASKDNVGAVKKFCIMDSFAAVCLSVAICFAAFINNVQAADRELKVHDEGRTLAVLSGEWEFQPVINELKCTQRVSTPLGGKWDKIQVPGFWDDQQEFGYPWSAATQGWYRYQFKIPDAFNGKRLHIRFDAIAFHAQVFLNGEYIGQHWGSYTPFELDATSFAKVGGNNELMVFVASIKEALPNANIAWDQYGFLGGWKAYQGLTMTWPLGECPKRRGIWQDVFLIGLEPVFVQDVYIKTSTRNKELEALIEIKNESTKHNQVRLECAIYSSVAAPDRGNWQYEATKPGDEKILSLPVQTITLAPNEVKTITVKQPWANPKLWEFDDPQLYYMVSEVSDGARVDRKETRFGFREIWADKDNLMLNGHPVHLLGVTAYAGVTAALCAMHNRKYWETLYAGARKQQNINAIRLMDIPNPCVLAVADEMGIMLESQADNWASNGNLYSYLKAGDEFLKNMETDFTEWIRRDRNHPSILIWCPQNEGWFGEGDHTFTPILRRMRETILANDKTRPIQYDQHGKCEGLADLAAIHYHWYKSARVWNKIRDIPLGCPEQTTILLATGDVPWEKDPWHKDPEFQEIAFSLGYQRMYGMYEVLMFGVGMDRMWVWKKTKWGSDWIFHDKEQYPLKWDSRQEIYAKPPHTSGWCNIGYWANIWAQDRPSYYSVPADHAEAFRVGFNSLYAGILEEGHDYASGQELKTPVKVINDTSNPQTITLQIDFKNGDEILSVSKMEMTVGPGEIHDVPLNYVMPEVKAYKLCYLQLSLLKSGKEIFSNSYAIDLYPASIMSPPQLTGELGLFDPKGATKAMFESARIAFKNVDNPSHLNGLRALVIGKDAPLDKLNKAKSRLDEFVRNGGRILEFERNDAKQKWLPKPISPKAFDIDPVYKKDAFNMDSQKPGYRLASITAPGHPIFRGLPDRRVYYWNTHPYGYISDFAYLPSESWKFLAAYNYSPKKSLGLVAELAYGNGSIVLSDLNLHVNYGKNPVATSIVHNLLRYILACPDMCSKLPVQLTAIPATKTIENDSCKEKSTYKVVKAGNVSIDGNLNEWMFIKGENGLLENWRMADPIVIPGSQTVNPGDANGNLDKSAVCYLMWDARNLYFSAMVIAKNGDRGGNAIELCLGKSRFTFEINGSSLNISRDGQVSDGFFNKIKYAIKYEPTLGSLRGANKITETEGDSVSDAPGYIIEMAIPMEYLPMITEPKIGIRFALGIAMYEHNKPKICWPGNWNPGKIDSWGVAELSVEK